jgi:protein tyrosine/serine phosphatase
VIARAPTPESFWVEPGKLLAGMYAGAETDTETAANLGALAAAGVTLIVDLSHESDGLPPYEAHVAAPMRRGSMPIRDFDVPTLEQLVETLAVIDDEIESGGLVFVHCLGGCGRTGTVVSSWLVKNGMTAKSALERYAELSREVCGRKCPERPEQFELVEAYAAQA